MKWAFTAGYSVGSSEIRATFSRKIAELRNELISTIEQLASPPVPVLEVNHYRTMLEDIKKRAEQHGDGDLTGYAKEIDGVWRELDTRVLHYQGPRIEHAFMSGLRLGFAQARCRLGHGVGVPDNLKAAESSFDEIKKTNLDTFTYDYKSQIAEIRRCVDAEELDSAVRLITDMFQEIKTQFPGPP
jgi:hypothetical protein